MAARRAARRLRTGAAAGRGAAGPGAERVSKIGRFGWRAIMLLAAAACAGREGGRFYRCPGIATALPARKAAPCSPWSSALPPCESKLNRDALAMGGGLWSAGCRWDATHGAAVRIAVFLIRTEAGRRTTGCTEAMLARPAVWHPASAPGWSFGMAALGGLRLVCFRAAAEGKRSTSLLERAGDAV